jgi:hypothetical protein
MIFSAISVVKKINGSNNFGIATRRLSGGL